MKTNEMIRQKQRKKIGYENESQTERRTRALGTEAALLILIIELNQIRTRDSRPNRAADFGIF